MIVSAIIHRLEIGIGQQNLQIFLHCKSSQYPEESLAADGMAILQACYCTDPHSGLVGKFSLRESAINTTAGNASCQFIHDSRDRHPVCYTHGQIIHHVSQQSILIINI